MAIIAGIDEAGYGPILGPLVVTSAAFRVEGGSFSSDLWERLADGVSRRARKGCVTVNDSKALFSRKRGLRRLEESTLAFAPAESFASFLQSLGAHQPEAWGKYPWYAGRDLPLPRVADAKVVARLSDKLTHTLAASGVAFIGAQCRAIDVVEFNRQVERFDNKSHVTAVAIADLLRAAPSGESVCVVIDKQGGRKNYRRFLAETFPGLRVRAELESANRSDYAILSDAAEIRVTFQAKADAHHLPVALASMISKYVRELFMELFNQYWAARVPDLRPTAGYYTDGLRFLADIESARCEAGVEMARIRRSR